jgi:hypothetical protein
MKKDPKDMTDQELLDTWKLACSWTEKRMQVTGTNKNELGKPYDHQEFMIALSKIEKLEDELQRRKITYGKSN